MQRDRQRTISLQLHSKKTPHCELIKEGCPTLLSREENIAVFSRRFTTTIIRIGH